MANTLLLASANRHKLEEIKWMLPSNYDIKSLIDIGWTEELPEPFETFEENAAAKTSRLFEATGIICFAEDSGLEIDALGGRPGVRSARYAGSHGDNQSNIKKVLLEMKNIGNRSARFTSVIAFQTAKDKIQFFTGKVDGDINDMPAGTGGFGYDPIFIPKGFDQTFASLPIALKNQISHRSKSMHQFIDHLNHL